MHLHIDVRRCRTAADVRDAAACAAAWRRRVLAQPPRPPEPPLPPPPPPRPPLPQREPWERPAVVFGGVRSRTIIEAAAARFEVSVQDILGRSRHKHLVSARHIAMFLIRTMRGMSLPQIAKLTGRADHTTVLHGCRHIEETPALLEIAQQLHAMLEDLDRRPNEGEAP